MPKITKPVLITLIFFILFPVIILGQIVNEKINPILLQVYNQKNNFIFPPERDKNGMMVYKMLPITPNEAEGYGIDLGQADPQINATIEYKGDISSLPNSGITIGSVDGQSAYIIFPLSKLPILNSMEEILNVGISPLGSIELDSSDHKVHAKETRERTSLYGDSIVVGFVDTGIDWTKGDFKDNGNTRIKYLWDQTETNTSYGSSPGDGFDYGRVYTAQDIDNNRCHEKDTIGHGTHVAGICVGNGKSDTSYIGMAPKADIVFVKYAGRTRANIIDGIKWIAKKAISLGKPWVCNLSLGFTYTSYDGMGKLDMAIKEILSGSESEYGKGRVIVKSAGNEGYNKDNCNREERKKYHIRVGVCDDTLGLTFTPYPDPTRSDEVFYMLIWYQNSDRHNIKIQSPSGNIYNCEYGQGDAPGGGKSYYGAGNDGIVSIYNESAGCNKGSFTQTNDRMILVKIKDDGPGNKIRGGKWHFWVGGEGYGQWDAYIYAPRENMTNGASFSEIEENSSIVVTEPGDCPGVLTVGSVNSKPLNLAGYEEDHITYFSSLGPTRGENPIEKPEIYAPGAFITSIKSSDAEYDPDLIVDNNHVNKAGTSMAAPHVTGLAALILQQDDTLSSSEVIDKILKGAQNVPNPGTYGPSSYKLVDFRTILQHPIVPLPSLLQINPTIGFMRSDYKNSGVK